MIPSTRKRCKIYRLESLYLVIRLRSFQLGEPVRRGKEGDRLPLERGAEALECVDDDDDVLDEEEEDEEESESEDEETDWSESDESELEDELEDEDDEDRLESCRDFFFLERPIWSINDPNLARSAFIFSVV